ncbi:MAG: hypothetical protein AAF297_03785 [Planctomycetota bacterium]
MRIEGLGSVALAVFGIAGFAAGGIITPDSAVASSEFSGSYLIGNTIDGSGLSAGDVASATHANYIQGNHWTTRAGEQVDATATFFFDDAQTVGQFLLWNHRSNVIAADPLYAVRTFDLELFDAAGDSLRLLRGLSAERDVDTAQVYTFGLVDGVRSATITIRENHGSGLYTGFAEARFSSVPAPGALAGLGLCGLFAAGRRRG